MKKNFRRVAEASAAYGAPDLRAEVGLIVTSPETFRPRIKPRDRSEMLAAVADGTPFEATFIKRTTGKVRTLFGTLDAGEKFSPARPDLDTRGIENELLSVYEYGVGVRSIPCDEGAQLSVRLLDHEDQRIGDDELPEGYSRDDLLVRQYGEAH